MVRFVEESLGEARDVEICLAGEDYEKVLLDIMGVACDRMHHHSRRDYE